MNKVTTSRQRALYYNAHKENKKVLNLNRGLI